jgi:hypothetical protein
VAMDCSPYKCSGSTCSDSCASIDQCTSGYVCNASHYCVAPTFANLGSGCAATENDGAEWSVVVGLLGLCCIRRRRSRRSLGADRRGEAVE